MLSTPLLVHDANTTHKWTLKKPIRGSIINGVELFNIYKMHISIFDAIQYDMQHVIVCQIKYTVQYSFYYPQDNHYVVYVGLLDINNEFLEVVNINLSDNICNGKKNNDVVLNITLKQDQNRYSVKDIKDILIFYTAKPWIRCEAIEDGETNE